MKALLVNADYEIALFEGRPAPKIVNQSLEFLALFLEQKPLFSTKKYSQDYLDYVEAISGHKPVIVASGPTENWWGKLADLHLEQRLNSKIESSKLLIDQGWDDHTFIIHSLDELQNLDDRLYLAKNPFGMSGQNFVTFNKCAVNKVEPLLKHGAVIVEPLFDRKYDFSHYVFSDGKRICYQNLVDDKFQYRGTVFNGGTTIQDLSFYSDVSQSEWKKFQERVEAIIKHYRSIGATDGFSIDSFVYLERGELKIRVMSEVNYRRTMGLVAHELAQKYGNRWSCFLLGKTLNHKQVPVDPHLIQLSPGDTRFEMFFLSGGKEKFLELKRLLPDCQFSVEL
ncbi:hypothetical protein ACJVC5_08100 [Peredibacter sp. HCB2-198]|uniref:hypothetical protein n=1 Tax=Peredibacter sp. HCB2-198 TaxID=3383025 RepID=UPI0038B6981E